MELGTLGAVLRFAIELESRSAEFYQKAASLAKHSLAEGVFLALAEVKRKRKELLERSRRENINEMLLEPISGLKGSNYLVETELSSQMGYYDALRLAIELEEKSRRFYVDAAGRVNLLEVTRVFEKLAEENANHKLRLESLHNKEGPGA